jgi:hypothetical protein
MSTAPITVNVTEDLSKAIGTAVDAADIRAAVIAEAEKQGAAAAVADATAVAAKAVADKVAADAAVVTGVFKRTETIGGREFLFEAESELELERQVNNALRVAYALQPTEPEHQEQVVTVDPAVAAKAAEEQAAAKAELELQYKRGEITTADYLEKSGAVDDYLAKKGIPLDSLKAAVDRNVNDVFEQSWADATQEFLNGPVGAGWPGGEKNRELLGMQLAAMNLIEATDKVAALGQAFAAMRTKGMIFASESAVVSQTAEQIAAAKIVADKTAADTAAVASHAATVAAAATTAAAAIKTPATSSSLFGRSSGVSGSTSTVVINDKAGKVEIPAEATPAEIMDAWKKGQIANGKNPNEAFIQEHAAHRV